MRLGKYLEVSLELQNFKKLKTRSQWILKTGESQANTYLILNNSLIAPLRVW